MVIELCLPPPHNSSNFWIVPVLRTDINTQFFTCKTQFLFVTTFQSTNEQYFVCFCVCHMHLNLSLPCAKNFRSSDRHKINILRACTASSLSLSLGRRLVSSRKYHNLQGSRIANAPRTLITALFAMSDVNPPAIPGLDTEGDPPLLYGDLEELDESESPDSVADGVPAVARINQPRLPSVINEGSVLDSPMNPSMLRRSQNARVDSPATASTMSASSTDTLYSFRCKYNAGYLISLALVD